MAASIKTYKFSEFVVNPARRTLHQGAIEIKLRDRNFDVLLFLIENAPNTCSADEIIETVWSGTSVENNSVEKAINDIRKALGDDAKKPRFIKTVWRKGYLFVGEPKVTEKTPPNDDVVESEIVNTQTHVPNQTSKIKPALLYFVLIFLLGLAGYWWWKGGELWTRYNSTVIFTDDFSSSEIDSNRWTATGKSVKLENGIAKLIVEETDNWGRLKSTFFTFDPNKSITVKSRIKVAYSRNIKDKTYFVGSILFFPKTSISEDDDYRDLLCFGITFANNDYDGAVSPNSPLEGMKTEGFFLVRNGGRPHAKRDYAVGKVSERIEPVWNEWFEQKLIYEPFSGKMIYFINNEMRGEFNAGELPHDLQENKLRLEITPWGWWLYHSIEIDYIEVTQ